jgi:hypothetical protein
MKDTASKNVFDFDQLYEDIAIEHFAHLDELDSRRSNKSITISDALKSAFAIYSLKASSLLDFRPKAPAEESNLKKCFSIKNIPSDSGLKKLLDRVDSQQLRGVFPKVIDHLRKHGVLDKYRFQEDYLTVSVDGVHHYSSKKISCPCCLERKHRDGTVTYSHSMLSAALVHPKRSEVFVIDNEPIVKQDGVSKNDCERNAATRLFGSLVNTLGCKPVVYALDALYGCAPVIKLITQSSPKWKYVINAKPAGHKHLFSQFDERNEKGEVQWRTLRRKEGTYEIGYTFDLELNASNKEVATNMVLFNYRPKKGKMVTFSWMTNMTVNADTVMAITQIGRSRWKIENEVFNTLKNQDYNFNHNFGHGQQHLATNFAYLMMLAFTIDQLRQYGSRLFRSIWKGLKTKKAAWDAIRTVFKMVTCESIDDLCHKLLDVYALRMIRI